MKSWLTGWKLIANHINTSVRTAAIYHKCHGMPVHRGPNNKPIALSEELDGWLVEFGKKSQAEDDENKHKISRKTPQKQPI